VQNGSAGLLRCKLARTTHGPAAASAAGCLLLLPAAWATAGLLTLPSPSLVMARPRVLLFVALCSVAVLRLSEAAGEDGEAPQGDGESAEDKRGPEQCACGNLNRDKVGKVRPSREPLVPVSTPPLRNPFLCRGCEHVLLLAPGGFGGAWAVGWWGLMNRRWGRTAGRSSARRRRRPPGRGGCRRPQGSTTRS
jgi:hypothetical protein